jgi:hypothetical protein
VATVADETLSPPLGAYYRAGKRRLDRDDVRALGYTGEVSGLGAWGPIVNGGAWLTIEDTNVDLQFRDLDLVEHWLSEAHAGRFEMLDQHGCLVSVELLARARASVADVRRNLRGHQ